MLFGIIDVFFKKVVEHWAWGRDESMRCVEKIVIGRCIKLMLCIV